MMGDDVETRIARICRRFSIPYFADEFQADSDGPNGGGSYALKQAPSADIFQLAGVPASLSARNLSPVPGKTIGGASNGVPGIVEDATGPAPTGGCGEKDGTGARASCGHERSINR